MAKVMFGGGVAQIRGSDAGTTYSRNRGGAYTRNRVAPIQPSTVYQQAVRARLTLFSKQWSSLLTQAQRDGWISFASSHPVTDVFGASIVLTGSQMYGRLNQQLGAAGLTEISDAPLTSDVESLATAVLTVAPVVPSATIAFSPSPLAATSHLQVFATPPYGVGKSFVKNALRLVVTSGAAETTSFEFQAAYVARFGGLAASGQKTTTLCRVIDDVTGFTSVGIRSDYVVP